MQGPWLKLGAAVLLVGGLGAILFVVGRASRRRAQLVHCRNNLRKMGQLAGQEIVSRHEFDEEHAGRRFWHEVRILACRKDTPRKKNEQIPAREVRLLAEDGSRGDVLPLSEAIRRARERGLDLVQVNPNEDPPLSRMVDTRGAEAPTDCRRSPCTMATHEHEWIRAPVAAFVCPVYGKTSINPEDPQAIDFLGPKMPPEPGGQRLLIGADRPGNHPDGGGFVLFADVSIKEQWSEVAPGDGNADLWRQAQAALSD